VPSLHNIATLETNSQSLVQKKGSHYGWMYELSGHSGMS